MQFIDLNAQQKRIRKEIEKRIGKVLDHGRYIMGPEIAELENQLAEYVGVPFAVGVGSGTDALCMALLAHDIRPNDVIFTTPFTFIATAEVVRLLGATPVFVDIQSDTFNLDPTLLDAAVRETRSRGNLNPRGIIAVDLFGQAADYDDIHRVARAHGLFVVEDAAQSFGGSYKGRMAGSLASVACTSFFPAKPLGGYGDGGMVFTEDPALHESLVSIRVHGAGTDKYHNIRIGINGRLDTLQAAILLAKMSVFKEEIEMRQMVAERYADGLKGLVTLPRIKAHNVSAWAQYSVLHPDRDRIVAALRDEGIPTAIYYPIPLHLQEAFACLGHRSGDFPISERIASEIFSLPMHPYLSAGDQDRIVDAVRRCG